MGSICATYFVERFHVRVLLIFDTNDVEAIAALHQITDLALGQRERSLLELGYRAAPADQAQFPALLCAAGIVGILLGQRRIWRLP